MEQIKWINLLKGIGIISVVLGHVYDGHIHRYIYMFHMPLFFFLSGYLLRPTNDYKTFLSKKTKSLLIPYIAFLLPLYLVSYGFPSLNYNSIIEYFRRLVIGGQLLQGRLGVLWFITCLFLTQQVLNFIISRFSIKSTITIMIVFLFLSYVNSIYFPEFWLMWNANTVLAAGPIFYCGYLYKSLNFKLYNAILIGIGLVLVFISYYFPKNLYDMKYTHYGYPIITLVSALVIILNLKLLSSYLAKAHFIEKLFTNIGKSSMIIMYLHFPLIIAIRANFTSDKFILSFSSIVISYLLFYFMSKFKITKALFLGDVKSQHNMKNKLILRNAS